MLHLDLSEEDLAIEREIGDRRGEIESTWNLCGPLLKQREAERGLAHRQAYGNLERQVGDPAAEQHGATLRGKSGRRCRWRGRWSARLRKWTADTQGRRTVVAQDIEPVVDNGGDRVEVGERGNRRVLPLAPTVGRTFYLTAESDPAP